MICNPPESIYCNQPDCPTCRGTVGQARQKLYKCDQCGKYREYKEDFYFLRRYEDDEPICICSPSCLFNYAKVAKMDQQEQQQADDEYFRFGSRWPGL